MDASSARMRRRLRHLASHDLDPRRRGLARLLTPGWSYVLGLFMTLAQPTAAPDDQIDPSRDRSEGCALRSEDPTEWHLRMLKELAEIGMDLARGGAAASHPRRGSRTR